VWGYVLNKLILSGPLNFFVSTLNQHQFASNYHYFNHSVKERLSASLDSEARRGLGQLYDVDTFINVF